MANGRNSQPFLFQHLKEKEILSRIGSDGHAKRSNSGGGPDKSCEQQPKKDKKVDSVVFLNLANQNDRKITNIAIRRYGRGEHRNSCDLSCQRSQLIDKSSRELRKSYGQQQASQRLCNSSSQQNLPQPQSQQRIFKSISLNQIINSVRQEPRLELSRSNSSLTSSEVNYNQIQLNFSSKETNWQSKSSSDMHRDSSRKQLLVHCAVQPSISNLVLMEVENLRVQRQSNVTQ